MEGVSDVNGDKKKKREGEKGRNAMDQEFVA